MKILTIPHPIFPIREENPISLKPSPSSAHALRHNAEQLKPGSTGPAPRRRGSEPGKGRWGVSEETPETPWIALGRTYEGRLVHWTWPDKEAWMFLFAESLQNHRKIRERNLTAPVGSRDFWVHSRDVGSTQLFSSPGSPVLQTLGR